MAQLSARRRVWNLTSDVHLTENTKLEQHGRRHTNGDESKQEGDFAEFYAVAWLWDQGYEVPKRCTGSGLDSY